MTTRLTTETDWDDRFLGLAEHWARVCSKDPSTQVGAVIVDDKRRVVGMGYNGFPRGIRDCSARLADRDVKYGMVVHAEPNAILNAVKSVEGCTLYVWPLFTCNECAKLVIQAGIARVVAPVSASERWVEKYDIAMKMYHEAGVRVAIRE